MEDEAVFHSIWVGCDHGGYEVKAAIVSYLQEHGYEVTDIGTNSAEIVRYPYYAARVAQVVASGKADGGVLICSIGIGMSMVANKFKGVRASVCSSHYTAMMTRRHNNSNVLCLGGKTLGIFEIIDILDAWLSNEYEGGRHAISLGMMAEGENVLLTGSQWAPEHNI